MKNPMTFFAVTQKALNRLKQFKVAGNSFTKEDYRQIVKLHSAASNIPNDCPDELKTNIEQSKIELLRSVSEILDMQFSDQNTKLDEANKIIGDLKLYIKATQIPDHLYIQTLVKQAGDIGLEALTGELEKEKFNQERLNVDSEVLLQKNERIDKKSSLESEENDYLEATANWRP